VKAKHWRRFQPRARRVRRPVADVRDPLPRDGPRPAKEFFNGKDVRKNLRWVAVVGEGIDDGDFRRRHFHHPAMLKGAVDDGIAVAFQYAGGIADRLAHAEAQFILEHREGMPAQLRHPGLKGTARAQAWLFHDATDDVPPEQFGVTLRRRLELRGEREHRPRLIEREITQIEEITLCRHRHILSNQSERFTNRS